jgi:hypothetical protein
MKNGMGVRPYKLDITKEYASLQEFLSERNPKTAETLEE